MNTRVPASPLARSWLPPAVTFFINGAGYGVWATEVPIAKARMAFSDSAFGLSLLAMGLGAVLAMSVSGRLISRFGTKRPITVSVAVFLISLPGIAFSPTRAVFVVLLIFFGGAAGMMDVSMNAYAARVEAHVGRPIMSSIHGMWSIGGLAGSALGGMLILLMPDAARMIVISVALAALFITIRAGLTQNGTALTGRPKARGFHRTTLIIGTLAAFVFAAESAVRDWSSLYLNRSLMAPLGVAGWGYSAFSAAMGVCRFGGDWVRASIGNKIVVVVYAAIATAGFVLTALSPIYGIAIFGFGLVGLGLSNIVPVLISVAGKSADAAGAVAIVVTFGYASYLVSPAALGFVAGQTSLSMMFGLLGAVILSVGVVWVLVCPAD